MFLGRPLPPALDAKLHGFSVWFFWVPEQVAQLMEGSGPPLLGERVILPPPPILNLSVYIQSTVFHLFFIFKKRTVLWVVTPCSLDKAWRFGRPYYLYLQGRSASEEINQQNLNLPHASAGYLLGLFCDPEGRCDMFLRNFRLYEIHGIAI
jgi:hypothetical protein